MSRTPGTYAVFNTSEGKIVCRLFEKEAPKTVANFVELAEGKREWTHPLTGKKSNDKLYDGTIFHRVIPDFMIQGGDPAGSGMGGPGYKFEDETKGSPHRFDKPGKLAMANAGPNTNGSQIFITTANTEWLTGKHTIFGEVVEGQDIAEKISRVKKGAAGQAVDAGRGRECRNRTSRVALAVPADALRAKGKARCCSGPFCFVFAYQATPMTVQSSFTASALLCSAACSSGVSLISMICSRPRSPSLQGTPT